MLEAFLGAEVFKQGLRTYIHHHAYGNATTTDLWQALAEASGQDVATLMNTWTTQPGYPLVSYPNGSIDATRFIASPREARQAAANLPEVAWQIPWSALVPDASGAIFATQPTLLTGTSASRPAALKDVAWFKPNPGEQGFWRSLYDQHLLKQLKPALESQLLPAADRYGVISDMWAVVAAGHTDTAVALEMVATLRSEPDYFVLVALLNGFGDMLAIVEDEALRDQLKIFGRWLVRGHYERLGWQARATDSHFDILLRAAILMAAVKFEVTGASDEAQRLFVDYARGGSLDANVRAAVLYGVAHRGGVAEYEQLLALYRRETAPQARQAQLVNLGRFQDPYQLQFRVRTYLDSRAMDYAAYVENYAGA
jgi:puromycin-sensitive aminopeptidase